MFLDLKVDFTHPLSPQRASAFDRQLAAPLLPGWHFFVIFFLKLQIILNKN